jgi:TolB-like protein
MPFADQATKNKGSLASAFSYKGKALRIQDVASELGVRFVLQHWRTGLR